MDRPDAAPPLASVMRRRYVTVAPADSARDAEVLMRMGRFRALPVVADDRLEGVLSYPSLARTLLAREFATLEQNLLETPVSTLMDVKPARVGPEASLAEAASRLVESETGCLPIVDRDGRLLGIVTEADLLRRGLADDEARFA
jgi:CBS domain-containing membrane protein